MSYRDFTIEKTDDTVIFNQFFGPTRLGAQGDPSLEIDVPHTLPLDGTGSLQMRILAANKTGHIYRTPVSKRGLRTGTLTSQFYAAVQASPGSGAFGLYCYGNQTSLLNAGNLYLLGALQSWSAGANPLDSNPHPFSFFLAKSTVGLEGFRTTATVLGITADDAWAVETLLTLRLSWQPLDNGHLLLTGSTGLLPDLSDMAQILQYEDASPLATTIVEGIWAGSSVSVVLKAFVDETEFFRGVRTP